jgi:hypothetical protein
MRAAQLVWDAALAEFADDVIETASRTPSARTLSSRRACRSL